MAKESKPDVTLFQLLSDLLHPAGMLLAPTVLICQSSYVLPWPPIWVDFSFSRTNFVVVFHGSRLQCETIGSIINNFCIQNSLGLQSRVSNTTIPGPYK
jgi:hypothetical protein